MLQAVDGSWWMIDAENDEWYRHDSDAKEWLLDYPEALRAWEDAQAADARPDEPTETVYELPPAYREPDEPVAGAPIVDERGVEIGRVPPTKDELYTFPATAAFADELPDQHLTAPAVTQAAGLSSREAPGDPPRDGPRRPVRRGAGGAGCHRIAPHSLAAALDDRDRCFRYAGAGLANYRWRRHLDVVQQHSRTLPGAYLRTGRLYAGPIRRRASSPPTAV